MKHGICKWWKNLVSGSYLMPILVTLLFLGGTQPSLADDLLIDRDPRLNRARTFICEGQANLARNYLSSLLKQHNNNVHVLNLRAFANLELKKYKETVADCTAVLGKRPGDVTALSRRAFANCNLRNYQAGIKDLDTILLILPDDVFSLRNRAQALARIGRLAESRADYQKATTFAPISEVKLARTKREFENVYKTINELLLDEPNNGYIIAAEARCNLHRAKYAEAADLATAAMELVPGLKTSLQWVRATALLRSSPPHTEQAISDLSAIINSGQTIVDWEMKPFCNKSPENDMWLRELTTLPDVYVQRGKAWLKVNKFEQAVEDANQALQRDSVNVSALEVRAAANNRLRKYDLALSDYKQALKLTRGRSDLVSLHKQTLRNIQGVDNGRVPISVSLAQTLRERGSYNEALETLAKLTEAESDIAVFRERVKSYEGLKKYKAAFNETQKMIGKFPGSPIGYTLRGDLQMHFKNYKQAVLDYTSAIKSGGSPQVLFLRAEAHKKLGNLKAAESDRLTGKLMMKK